MEKKNLIIDCQVLQTEAWHRGMGKYTLQLIQELGKLAKGKIGVSLIFNSVLSLDESRLEAIKYLCPDATQYQLDLPIPEGRRDGESQYKNKLSKFIAENFSNQKNYYAITSLFTFDFYALFPDNCHKALLFYDLTPLLFWRDLGGYFPPHLYLKRFKEIYAADIIFSISETTRKDLINITGISSSKVVNINGGNTNLTLKTEKPKNFVVPERYVLFPTGDLPHKNNELGIKGFTSFNRRYGNDFSLLVTSRFNRQSQEYLSIYGDKVVFTGNVKDEELSWLYKNAEAILFTSKYEGLGIPLLDAASHNKPSIVSRIPVFEEISKEAFYYFDVDSSEDLDRALEEGLAKRDYDSKSKIYRKLLKKYSWKKTAEVMLDTILAYQGTTAAAVRRKKKVAIVSLHPGIKNQVGRLAELLSGKMQTDFSLTFFFDPMGLSPQEIERPTFLDQIDKNAFDITSFNIKRYKEFDEVIYLIDDTGLNSQVSFLASVLPGILFHDIKLSNPQVVFITVLFGNQIAAFSIDNSKPPIEQATSIYKTMKYSLPSQLKQNYRKQVIKKHRSNKRIMKLLLAEVENV